YLPDKLSEKTPAILNVHGHWTGAKNAPEVHSRCVFLAKRGFIVLSLDAIGAGERAYKGIAYHGRQLGYQILPTGKTFAGLQIEDNRRAIDLLCSLPDVDPKAIGVTGASGGGNQTFNLTVLDPRIQAAVGVCFFGSYEGYLHGAHCACELVPGALTYADEGTVAGLIAPRPFAIFAAREDHGAAFQIADAREQAEIAKKLYALADANDQFEFIEYEGGHDYSQVMRETMVAFFEKHLMGKDNDGKIPEPQLDVLAPEELQVLDEKGLPEGSLFVPQLVAKLAEEKVESFESEGKDWANPNDRPALKKEMIERVFGGFPVDIVAGEKPQATLEEKGGESYLESEPGVRLPMTIPPKDSPQTDRIILVLGDYPEGFAPDNNTGCEFATLSPRGTGPTRCPSANTVDCEDYLLAQGSNILGRPMLGQWTLDALAAVAALRKEFPNAEIFVYGEGVMGLAALFAGVLDEEIAGVATSEMLSSYVWPGRFDDRWGLVHFVPGILEVGDLSQIARGISPRPLLIASPRNGDGSISSADKWKGGNLRFVPEISPSQALDDLARLKSNP
ncbi:MAG: acetylxylan esterase, partial [Candidatus Omnitrophica bacterium]|nr:acetylxylan esterase [Candidatus Omnitrophota bacterium]